MEGAPLIIGHEPPKQPSTSASITVVDTEDGQVMVLAEFGGIDFNPGLASHQFINSLLNHSDTLAKPEGDPVMMCADDVTALRRGQGLVAGG